ncbi:carbonic anhydrase [Nonomuraea jiangxiensis]|uniref:Carbonic anhydrase n=1 Tax=Nonomuraea jiangxiensis TaxID=633440 RepID=A0A1G7ZQV9_9ACTN|nr:carbonic anhydrase [Nonomuraea jiangxiensis]SDH11078.1 carbonic anhydrase [Nonomuraea jiangxiensis]
MTDKIINRRTILTTTTLAAGGLLLGGGTAHAVTGRAGLDTRPTTSDEAWAKLREGNRRWAADAAIHPHQDAARRAEVAQKQNPYAVVVSCIDSRVPPEIVFDAGIGDVFSVRSAAQTLDPLVKGAVEYGPVELDTPLIVVLGHQRCGAVTAAAEALHEGTKLPGDLQRIVEALRPAYKRAHGDVDKMIRINTADVVATLKADKLLAPRIARKRLKIVGAYYSLDTGQVTRVA